MTPPLELDHALRHVIAAHQEWDGGRLDAARVHLREAICDASWALFKAQLLTDREEVQP